MINDKTDLLDPSAKNDLSDFERQVVEDAQNAGKNPESAASGRDDDDLTAARDTGGIIEQTIDSEAVEEFGKPGGDSDISGGIPNLDETTKAKVEQNEYNK